MAKKHAKIAKKKVTAPKKSSKATAKKETKTENKKESKEKSSSLIIGIIIGIVIIAFLSAVFIIKPGQDTQKYKDSDYEIYNGFVFDQSGDFWITNIELNGIPYEAPFYNHPLDVQDTPYDESITPFILETGHSNFIIAVSDNVGSTPVLAGANIARITGKLYGIPTSSALYATPDQRDENQTGFPYVDCSDATRLTPIFWINVNDTTQSIYRDQNNSNCIIVGATNNDEILESSDVFAYHILQII